MGIYRGKKHIGHYLIMFFAYSSIDNLISATPATYFLRNKEGFKCLTTNQITELNSHLTLICPEIEKESHIEWFKDDKLLNSSFRNNMGDDEEPHLTIDAYNSLYILHATKREEGTYSCIVDGQNVQKYNVIIVSKSRLLNEDFIRYSFYLGFVLSLTLSCYCAGICLAWHRRASFADPLNLYKQKQKEVRNIS